MKPYRLSSCVVLLSMQKFDFPDIDDEFVDKIQLRQYINAAIDTLSTSIAILIINKYSTDDMKTYKWFLMNITVSIEKE